jgi:hypothetical protein
MVSRPKASIRRGNYRETPKLELVVNRNLKSGKLDFIEITPSDAIYLAEELLKCANILREREERDV